MINMKIALLSSIIFFIIFSGIVHAHCPLCTAATGAAVAVTRFYGIDDLVIGLFIGGFILSTTFWFDRVLRKRNRGAEYIPLQTIILISLGLVSTFLSFYWASLLDPSAPTLLGINRLILGTIIGTAVSFSAFEFHKFIRRRFGRSFIPFQGIVFTLLSLTLVGLGFYAVGWL